MSTEAVIEVDDVSKAAEECTSLLTVLEPVRLSARLRSREWIDSYFRTTTSTTFTYPAYVCTAKGARGWILTVHCLEHPTTTGGLSNNSSLSPSLLSLVLLSRKRVRSRHDVSDSWRQSVRTRQSMRVSRRHTPLVGPHLRRTRQHLVSWSTGRMSDSTSTHGH